jgi:ParB family chromosome partitioning protein
VNNTGATLAHLPVATLKPDPDNIRRGVGDVRELAASITAQGVLEPLLVTDAGDGVHHLVVCGHRRLEAARVAGLAAVPCIVRQLDQAGRLEAQVSENLQRADLSPIEEALAYRRLIDLRISQRKLVTRVGRSQSHLSKRLGLLKLPAEMQDLVAAGELSVGDAQHLQLLRACPERMAEAVGVARRHGRPVRDAVKHQLAEHERLERRAAARAELEAAGETVIEEPARGWYGAKERPLDEWRWPCEPPSVDQVRADGHLAAAVRYDGEVVWVCTRPLLYEATAKGADAAAADLAERRQRAERRALLAAKRAAARARHQREADVLANGAAAKPEGLRVLAAAVVDELSGLRARQACERLGLEAEPDRYGHRNWRQALRDHAELGEEQLLRTALVLAVDSIERRRLAADEWSPDVGVRALYELLGADDGYRPSPYEARLLGADPGAPLLDALADGIGEAPKVPTLGQARRRRRAGASA